VFVVKDSHFALNCSKNFATIPKILQLLQKDDHIIKKCLIRHPKKSITTYTTLAESSRIGGSMDTKPMT
jgi:hypothetical protein